MMACCVITARNPPDRVSTISALASTVTDLRGTPNFEIDGYGRRLVGPHLNTSLFQAPETLRLYRHAVNPDGHKREYVSTDAACQIRQIALTQIPLD